MLTLPPTSATARSQLYSEQLLAFVPEAVEAQNRKKQIQVTVVSIMLRLYLSSKKSWNEARASLNLQVTISSQTWHITDNGLG